MARPPGRDRVTSGPPPSRYRVVEQDRRLVVIDTLTDESATRDRGPVSQKAPLGPERIAFDGRAVLVTRPFYDDKAPRRLMLDDATATVAENARSIAIGAVAAAVAVAILMPAATVVLVAALAIVGSKSGRAALRAPITAWLDRYDTPEP